MVNDEIRKIKGMVRETQEKSKELEKSNQE